MDVSAIEPGRDFRKAIDQSVRTCSALLAIIGQGWLECRDAQGLRRLEDADDFVRLELASALRRDIAVVPVLVRGARMPAAERLPEDLRDLVFRNAAEITHARWKSDVQVLIRSLRLIVGAGVSTAFEQAPTVAAASLPPETLERVRVELAYYVGPIAEVIVRRAARSCPSVEELIAGVAREIEGEAQRARFLKAWRG